MFVPSLSPQFTFYDIDPTRINESLSADTTLANGGMVLVSEDIGSSSDLFLRIYDPNGQSATGLLPVNTATFSSQKPAQVVELQNGTILVAWTDRSETVPDFNGDAVRFQLFSATGQRIGSETVAPAAMNGDQTLRSLLALEDGRFVLVWQQDARASSSVMRLFNADGSPATGDIVLPAGFGSTERSHIAGDGNGGLIAAGFIGNVSGTAVILQRYSANGSPTGDLIEVTRGGTYRDLRIVELANGGHVVTWTDTSETPPYNKGPIVRGQVIGENGERVGSVFTVSEDIFSSHRSSIVTALQDGRFVVTWDNAPVTGFQFPDDLMRVFNADGTPASDVITVYDAQQSYDGMRIGLSNLKSISELPDGRLVYLYSALDPTGSFFLTATRIVDPRTALDTLLGSGNDTFEGTTYNDRIDGAGGNDTLNGGDGSDTLVGGIGDDFLYGGSSTSDLRDVIFGGDGNDQIDGGYGNDSLAGGNGGDVVLGGFGSDTLIGNDGDDLIGGGAGSDLMFGNAGNDTLNGGFGYDRMNGGAGADSFFHAGIADHASDWIQDYTAGDGDVLTVGLAGATRAQFQVNFTNTPGAGDSGVNEAFVIYRPTGQILWALVDGAGQSSINISIGGEVFDLLA